MNKIIIFDASTIINLAMNGLLDILKKLRQNSETKFIITSTIKKETIERPSKIKKYELAALQIKQLIIEKIIEMPESIGINFGQIEKETKKMFKIANHTFFAEEKWISPIDEGEISCLALARILGNKNVIVAMDERTTRMLCEKPENLKKLFEKKMHTRVFVKKDNLKFFKDFKIIRSSEIVYVAYKKGLFPFNDPLTLDALLYGTKFKGASISREEIEEIKQIEKAKTI